MSEDIDNPEPSRMKRKVQRLPELRKDNTGKSAPQPMKSCKTCQTEKPLEKFHACKHTRDGKTTSCKPCANARARAHHQSNKAYRLERQKEYYQENKPYFHALSKKWAKKNPDKRLQISRESDERHREKRREESRAYYYRNPAKFKAWQANNYEKVREMKAAWRSKNGAQYNRGYRDKLRKATPEWADINYMNDIYKSCRELEEILAKLGLNKEFHVDHIAPLQSDDVCGLHCANNIQVLEARENRNKSNRLMI